MASSSIKMIDYVGDHETYGRLVDYIPYLEVKGYKNMGELRAIIFESYKNNI